MNECFSTIYIANNETDNISVISKSNIISFSTQSGPREIIQIEDKLVVSESGNHSISKYSLNDFSYFTSTILPDEPRAITSTCYGIIAILKNKNQLILINDINEKYKEITVTSSGPRCIAYDEQDSKIFISCNTANCIDVFDFKIFKIIHHIGVARNPYSICVTPNDIFVTSIGDNCVQAFSRPNFDLKWQSEEIKHPTSIVLTKSNSLITNSFDDNWILELDSMTGHILKKVSTRKEPFQICFFDHLIAVTSHGENFIQLFSSSLNFVQEYSVGLKPHGILFLK